MDSRSIEMTIKIRKIIFFNKPVYKHNIQIQIA